MHQTKLGEFTGRLVAPPLHDGVNSERNSGQLRRKEPRGRAESRLVKRVWSGCGPGGRGFESRRSPLKALQMTKFAEVAR